MQGGQGRSLIDYGSEIPAHLNAGWASSDALIESKPEVIQKALNAIYGGVAYLQANEEEAINLLMELNQIERDVAVQEYQEQFKRLSADGAMTVAGAQAAIDLAVIGGMTDLAPAADIISTKFKIVPTE